MWAAAPPGRQLVFAAVQAGGVAAMSRNRVRIIGGAWRGRLIRFRPRTDLRPTPDRVRETLFNWLGQDLSGRVCLDLFAGSGWGFGCGVTCGAC